MSNKLSKFDKWFLVDVGYFLRDFGKNLLLLPIHAVLGFAVAFINFGWQTHNDFKFYFGRYL